MDYYKTSLHIHTKEDPRDSHIIRYSYKDLIKTLAEKGFSIISITNHDSIFYNKNLARTAEENNILLIPGIEMTIEGVHILGYNLDREDVFDKKGNYKIKKLEDIEKIKREDNLIIPAHVFYGFHSINNKLFEHCHLFDALEFSFFYTDNILSKIPNKKAIRAAERYNMPLIGTSDVHDKRILNETYTKIKCNLDNHPLNSKKNIKSVIRAIKNAKNKDIGINSRDLKKPIEIITNPLSNMFYFRKFTVASLSGFLGFFKH
ncbi:MAG: PHP domain-containing protein [Nanoarchaeota archaeon]|nr:PHP domain-containing protein [Nanoarchaeota archaeon]